MASVLAVVVLLACCCLSGTQASSPLDYEYDPEGGMELAPEMQPPPGMQPPPDMTTTGSEMERLTARVAQLEREANAKVAFSASLMETTELRGNVGPNVKSSVLVFKKVNANVGNAYDSTTGIFTAPQRGVYYLRFSLTVGGTGSVYAVMLKNRDSMLEVYETAGANNSGANGITLQLEQGDRVSIAMWAKYSVYDNSRLSTFSGFLIFPN